MKEFIEKLIERLEGVKSEVNTPADNVWNNAVKVCIDNVNEVAEEYKNEFCEWKWGIDSAQVQCMGDRILFGSRRLFSYCPYCGKKIKVVE